MPRSNQLSYIAKGVGTNPHPDILSAPLALVKERILTSFKTEGEHMQAKVRWREGVCFSGENDAGNTLLMDGPAQEGGQGRGPRPMELLLLGLGGCTAYDVLTILRKARRPPTTLEVQIKAERAQHPPRVFTAIHLHYQLSGPDLRPTEVARAIRLSAEKYCSASIMLGHNARISHDFKIQEPQ